MKLILIVTIFPAALAFGQVTGNGPASPNSVTVTASRNTSLQPDQAVFAVTVASGIDVSRDSIVAALQGAGITSANFMGVSTVTATRPAPAPQLLLGWNFSLTVALSNMKSAMASLTAAQTSIAKNNSGLTLTFSVQGTTVSPQLQQAQSCAVSDLFADARAKAQKLAGAAVQPVGTVLAMWSASVVTDPGSGLLPAPTYLPVCSLTAKFALGTGPVDGDTLTITASRPVKVEADQVVIGVSVSSGATLALDDIVAALQGSGITAANLSTTYTVPQAPGQSLAQWLFTLTVPFSKLNETLSSLARIQQSVGTARPVLDLNYFVQGMQVSPESQASQPCPTDALVADAQVQARKLATAAAVGVGPILALADAGLPGGTPTIASRIGDFSVSTLYDPVAVLGYQWFLTTSVPVPPACSITAQFKLLR